MGTMNHALYYWLGTTVCLFVVSYLVPGVNYENWQALVVASLVLAILNSVFRPVLIIISLPLVIVTFGIFLIILNALLLLLTSWIVDGFLVEGMLSSMLASILISLMSLFLGLNKKTGLEVKTKKTTTAARSSRTHTKSIRKDDDVIDI